MYTVEKWAAAKTEFVNAIKVAIAAKEIVARKLKESCGQNLEIQELDSTLRFNWETQFPGIQFLYTATRVVLRGCEIPNMTYHWNCKLNELEQETEFLKTLAKPEQWELLWANGQD